MFRNDDVKIEKDIWVDRLETLTDCVCLTIHYLV